MSAALFAVLVAQTLAWGSSDPPVPADERRLGAAALRADLKKRGLIEFLELHLAQFPPATETETRLMMRDVRLAEAADVTRSDEARLAALGEGNALLQQLIESLPDDSRRFDWRFTLAHSLLYEEGDRFLTSLLYRGGTVGDCDALRQRSTRAVDVLTELLAEIADELQRIDGLDVREFEQLDATGFVERLDRLSPQAEYLRLWAWYYDALTRDAGDVVRTDQLQAIQGFLAANPMWLDRPHHLSHVRVQVLVLAGMTCRLQERHEDARTYLDRAIVVADELDDQEERDRVDWAVTLAWIEGARNERDAARYEAALDRLDRFRSLVEERGDAFALDMVAALIERSVAKARHDGATAEGDPRDAARWRRLTWQPLSRLLGRYPDRRDEIYATVYDTIDTNADPATLDPFEQAAAVAGSLFAATTDALRADAPLARAVAIGQAFSVVAATEAPALVPEVTYNTAVAQYRLGRQVDAARSFLAVASEHPRFEGALQAARVAVQLGAEIYGDPALRTHPEAQQLFRRALEVMLTQYADTDAARYWRFYYAQLLEDLGEFAGAIEQYALVDASHEHYLNSRFSHARCQAVLVQKLAGATPRDTVELQRRTNAFFDGHRAFTTEARAIVGGSSDAELAALARSLLARARVTAAQVQVLEHVNRPAQGLDGLADFEVAYPGERSLAGAVWRVRLLAYERLGRFDDATRAVPAYLAADPENAGATLQTLYDGLTAEIERLHEEDDETGARSKAEMGLLLAREIHAWSSRQQPPKGERAMRALTLQLAQAHLEAGQPDTASGLFEPLMPISLDPVDALPPADLHVVMGYAESLFRRGEFVDALHLFNKLATGLAPEEPLRWQSLLRDLQCRTALEHPPEGIVAVIQQQSFLYPDLGGEKHAAEFQRLRRENQRRAASGP